MLKSRKKQPQSVADKVAALLTHQAGSDNSADESQDEANAAARIVDFEDEYALPEQRSTDIRKRNVKLLSEQSARYRGKIASRREFEKDESEAEEEQSDFADTDSEVEQDAEEGEEEEERSNVDDLASNASSEYDAKTTYSKKQQIDEAAEEQTEDSNSDMETEEDVDSEEQSDDDDDEDMESDAEANIVSTHNKQAEMEKGQCVRNQLYMWERLLELRINTQKLLSKANELPAPHELQQQKQTIAELPAVLEETAESSAHLLNSLLQLQSALFTQFSELKNNVKNTLKRTLPINHSTEAPATKRFAEHLQTEFGEFSVYRNQVLIKWDDRTKLLTPGIGDKKKSMQEDFDIKRKIENALVNRSALIEKTQMRKNHDEQQQQQMQEDATDESAAMNQKPQRDANIYDDSDFYLQQLRELIEYQANYSSNMSEVTKQLVALQKLRQNMKKKVDTRASKGRKLRYVVHKKLINFMAPNDDGTWTNESKDELYKSLFKAS